MFFFNFKARLKCAQSAINLLDVSLDYTGCAWPHADQRVGEPVGGGGATAPDGDGGPLGLRETVHP